mgnify:CR=1 FL=1
MTMRGNVESKGIIYLTKALHEIIAVNNSTMKVGGKLLNDENSAYNPEVIDLRNVLQPIKWILNRLCLSEENKIPNEEELIQSIHKSLANMYDISNKFKDIGIEIDCDAFDGHFYNAISSLSMTLDYFCGIELEDDEAHFVIDAILSIDNYMEITKDIVNKYSGTIREQIKTICDNW